MSTITKEFTKEQLIEQAKKNIEVLRGAVEKIPGASDAAVIHLKLAEITLASLEAEAVAYTDAEELRFHHATSDMWPVPLGHGMDLPLYAAPPAPVSVRDDSAVELLATDLMKRIDKITGERHSVATLSSLRVSIVEACRAALLQGADGNSPVIPEWQAKAEKMAEIHGTSFVVFRNGESPQCAEPSKVIISFTDEGLGHGDTGNFREIVNSSTKDFRENAEASTKCWCRTCRPITLTDMRFVVCPECGNKRCPHANDHRNACTGSNEPGQEGSAYPAAPQQEVKQ